MPAGLRGRDTAPFMAPMTTKRRYLPVSYDVAGKRVAIAGNGPAALSKLDLLAQTQARITLYAPAPHPDLTAAATAAGIECVASYPEAADLIGMTLLFVATEDTVESDRLSRLARSMGVAVNAVDRPHLADFAVPSIVDRGIMTVAIASDGAAPVLAQRVRSLIDGLLPSALANLGDLARSLRATVIERLPANAQRRRFWWRLLDGDAGAAALAGDLDQARALALKDIELAVAQPPGKAFLIPAPKTPDLLTLRAQRVLLCADVLVHDPDVAPDMLAIARRDGRRLAVGADAGSLLSRLAREGHLVARLSRAGLAAEIESLRHAGIEHEVLPSVVETPSPAASLAA